jgi:CubicO group peptidase (beta-lactamase class C family)/dienelactone hydrolase
MRRIIVLGTISLLSSRYPIFARESSTHRRKHEMTATLVTLVTLISAAGEIREHPGGKELPHDKYIRVVSEIDSPVQQVYVKTKDGLYVAAAVRKPKGDGPFPALVMFHGYPGGRGMEQLAGWSSGATGGPVWERFLQEGYVVVVADYRRIGFRDIGKPIGTGADQATYVDDGIAIVDYVAALPYVDKARVDVYGVSLGGNLVLHLIGRRQIHAAIVGAPAPMSFLAISAPEARPGERPEDRFKRMAPDPEQARKNIEPIRCPILILVGTADGLLPIDRTLHDLLEKGGKSVRLEIYEKGYHDFCLGPQGHAGRKEPLLDITLDALEESVKFLRDPTRTAADPPKAFSLPAIDAYVQAQVRDQGYPGLSLAIMRDGKIVFAKGYGKRSIEDGAPVEPDTLFAVGSVTKQFACACILLLAEEGKLSVDDKVAKYYPALTRADQITLYDLMTHTSGYADYYPLDFVDRRLVKPIDEDALLSEYAEKRLDFKPGARWSYSNTGYVVLGRVVEKVSGKPFGQFLKERILDPLGMTHSAIEPGSDIGLRARGYTAFALGPLEPAPPEADGWLSFAGNLWASASDLVRWDLALIEGRVLKPASLRLMTTSRVLNNFKRAGYGCGLALKAVDGETVLTHFGAVSGFYSSNAIIPKTRSAVVVLTNSEHLNPGAIHTAILELLIKDQKAPLETGVPKVDGPSPKDAALDFFHQMQSGQLNRNQLGEEFSVFLTDGRIKSAAPRLKTLGEPEKVEVESIEERGGMEVASILLTFKTTKLHGLLYRTPDGKIQQLLFRKR